jgi:Uma2 family endonuclease
MSASLSEPMTRAEFLDWEERQELRYEFDGARVVAMIGGTLDHSLIQGNLFAALHAALRDGPRRVHGGHAKIETARGYRYPDVFVTCADTRGQGTVAREPVVVFEVLSPSTSRVDRIVKVREYGDTPSIRRYVILEQTAQAATVFSHDAGQWSGIVVQGDASLDLPEIGVSLPLTEIYRGVEFPPDTPDGP